MRLHIAFFVGLWLEKKFSFSHNFLYNWLHLIILIGGAASHSRSGSAWGSTAPLFGTPTNSPSSRAVSRLRSRQGTLQPCHPLLLLWALFLQTTLWKGCGSGGRGVAPRQATPLTQLGNLSRLSPVWPPKHVAAFLGEKVRPQRARGKHVAGTPG